MCIMSGGNKVIPVAIFTLFLVQILSPVIEFPTDELPGDITKKSQSIEFTTGSGHDLAGDVISIDGKNWTVRGDSNLDYWDFSSISETVTGNFDLTVSTSGVIYACSIKNSEINFHTQFLNGSFETLLVEDLGSKSTNDCTIDISNENRIQIAYDVSSGQNDSEGASYAI